MGAVFIGEAVYLVILSAGANREVIRGVAALGLFGAVWAVSREVVAAVAVAVVAAVIFEVCARVMKAIRVPGGWLGAVLAQGGIAVITGGWLIRESLAKGLLLGTPYPAMFLVAAFWIPSVLSEMDKGEKVREGLGPAVPAIPVVVTSAATFVTMMLQAYALLPFGALAGFLLEKELSPGSGRRHGWAVASAVLVGALANELSYRLSL